MAIEQNKNTVNFGGWSTAEQLKDWEQAFDVEYNDDGELILASKETFKHDEPESNLVFEYKYCIDVMDIYSRTGDSSCNNIVMNMYLIPLAKYWNDKAIESVKRMNGWDDYSDEQCMNEICMSDAIQNGSCILMEQDSVSYDVEENDEGFYDVLDNADVVEKLNVAATIFEASDHLRGFKLDCYQNRIGSTGWDKLEEILNGKDAIQAALERYKEENK